MRKNAELFYGTAGKEFVKRVGTDVSNVRSNGLSFIKKFVKEFCSENTSSEVRRVCEVYGIIGFAGELAIEKSVVEWNPGDARWASGHCFRKWKKNRGNEKETLETMNGIKQYKRSEKERVNTPRDSDDWRKTE